MQDDNQDNFIQNNQNSQQSEFLMLNQKPNIYTYAGFWWRLFAFFIDNLLISSVNIVPSFIVNSTVFKDFWDKALTLDIRSFQSILTYSIAMIGYILVTLLIWSSIDILYHSLLESTSLQGSFGKKILSMKVTDEDGNRETFKRALYRNCCKLISQSTFFVGYFFAAFTEKKQALHDIIAKTLVIRKLY